jgi:putative nucleotidyltransferase with HDIG domain
MIPIRRVRHRVTQFFRTLSAPFLRLDETYAVAHLSPKLMALFRQMPRAEQQHGIAMCRALEDQGHYDPDLLTAALLHDVGKARVPLWIFERVLVVLGEHYLPQQAARWSRGEPQGWRRGFVIRRMHPQWGADLVKQAGAPARVVTLIRRHHESVASAAAASATAAADAAAADAAIATDDAALAALQALDEA